MPGDGRGTRQVPLTTSVPAGTFLYADRRGQEETPSPLATWVRIAHVDGLGQKVRLAKISVIARKNARGLGVAN